MQENVLFLGPADSPLVHYLRQQGESVVATTEKISEKTVGEGNFTFLISYGYRHILRRDVLSLFPGRAVNLHISYLPWNRGSDPNFWSFVEDTPKGVTIHYLDEGVDTGDIIAQARVSFESPRETLASTYEKLQAAIRDLFMQEWPSIKAGNCKRQSQRGEGSIHKLREKDRLNYLLTDGWNTQVSVLEEYAADVQMSAEFWRSYDAELANIQNVNSR